VEIETKYAVRLFFANPAFTQVYFEAVANAIDAGADSISIEIRTDGKIHDPQYVELTVRDNGEGFTDERFARFRQVKEPQDAYHKGLGRLVFLHYFSKVAVSSVYGGNKRTFTFAHNFDGRSTVVKAKPSDIECTQLEFRAFAGSRIRSYEDLRPGAIRQMLLEQFLPELHDRKQNGKSLRISIELKTDETNPQKDFLPDIQVLTEESLPQFKESIITDDTIDGFSAIEVAYSVQQGGSKSMLLTAASVDGRTIPLKLLSPTSVPAGTSAIFLFRSDLFAGRSDSARQRLVLPEGLSEAALHRALKKEVSRLLSDEIPTIKEQNERTREAFEDKFPHLIGLFDTDTVGLIDRDEALEGAQKRFFQTQKQIIDSDPTDEVAFQKSLEISARSLMEYVLYRDWVIQRLSQASPKDLEATVHEMIVPRYNRFEQPSLVDGIYRNNAWILDDKFMTFRTILSESSMNEVIKAITLEEDEVDDEGRPDISMIFSADPEKEERVDVVVVELKRKRIDDKEATYAATQLLKRARKLVDHCPNIQRVWYYGIVEIDDDLSTLLIDMKWAPLYSKGKVYYQEFSVRRKADNVPVSTPTFLLSFDAITADASARNHAFLELLKVSFKGGKV
jgi:hypothetical protein